MTDELLLHRLFVSGQGGWDCSTLGMDLREGAYNVCLLGCAGGGGKGAVPG